MRKIFIAFLVSLFFTGVVGQSSIRAQTQSAARLSLYGLQTSAFPTISAGVEVFDSAGNVATGLKPEMITVLEDKQPRPLSTF